MTVSVERPGITETVTEMVEVTNNDGTITEHEISAVLSIPSEVFHSNVTVSILHPEHVRAELVEREPLTPSRNETAALASTIHADDPYEALTLPEPEEEETAEQTSATDDEARDLFDCLGWWWPW